MLRRLIDRLNRDEHDRLMVRLDATVRAEECLYATIMSSQSEARIKICTKSILDVREARAVIMDQLGWKRSAADLRADTQMRRGWVV